MLQSKLQLMTPGVVHVTNLTPGSGNPKSGLDSMPKTRIGTPAYIAPEVYQGRGLSQFECS
jgi:serine/threonine protein kinase